MLPATRDDKITAAYVGMRLMQLRGSKKQTAAPANMGLFSVRASVRDSKLTAFDIVSSITANAHKALSKDRSRYDEIRAAVTDVIDAYYDGQDTVTS